MQNYLFRVRFLVNYTTVDSVSAEEEVESIVVTNVRSPQAAWLLVYEKVRNYTLVSISSELIDRVLV